MNARKLLDWRKLLIYSHRWMGILGGLLFVTWFFSGVTMMYWSSPSFTAAERLSHVVPIDLSSAQVEPMDAARSAGIEPASLRVAMHYDGRPVYKFQGNTTVYADTGQVIGNLDSNQALDLVRRLVPNHAATVRYDALMTSPDQWTLPEGYRAFMPIHRIAVGNPEDSYYYISGKTGEPVMETDRKGRVVGFLSTILHFVYIPALKGRLELWNHFIIWVPLMGSLMCLSGLAVGVWRYSSSRRFRQKGVRSHSPYSGWMRWHHYAGLIFGLVSCTWAFSGALSINPWGWYSSTAPTVEQRLAVSGGTVHLEAVTLDGLRRGIAEIVPSFAPKEVDVLQFRGKLYLTANDPVPANGTVEHRMVSLEHPEQGTFKKFDDAIMMDIAREAMPDAAIQEATWLTSYDNYYRNRYNATLQRVLPVLRVRYSDSEKTWLYLDPHHGAIASKEDRITRVRRWLYNGLHSFDFPYIYDNRVVRDVLMIAMSIGCLLLSVTTLLPAFRRLQRHTYRAVRWLGYKPENVKRVPVVQGRDSGI
jgi:hypothetical protein